jgi:predicted AAA+ superfamily ATPase
MDNLYIPRLQESRLIRLAKQFPAVAVLGPRQVGKTSLVQAIRNQIGKPSVYLDLERQSDLAQLRDLESFVAIHRDQLVILDEIHRQPGLFAELRGAIDRHRQPGRFIFLGSASAELLRGSSESLAGRVAYLDLHGLALPELPDAIDFRTLWLRGGFPDSLLAGDGEASQEWRLNYIRSYVERELPRLGLGADPTQLRRLWTMLAHDNAQLLNKTKLANSLDLNGRTLTRYLSFYEQAFLIRSLPPYYVNVGKRLTKSPKLYLRDTGILHTLLGIDSTTDLLSHPGIGASWETFIIETLWAIKPQWAEYNFYRTQNGAEVDLVVLKGGMPYAVVEIKHASAPTLRKGFHTCAQDLQPRHQYVVAPVETNYLLSESVTVLGPYDLDMIFN